MVVGPGSANVNGAYRWQVGRSPVHVPLADAPEWLLEWANAELLLGAVGGKKLASGGPPLERAKAYLDHCPPAVSGQGGHSTTFRVARAIVWGFDLGAERGLQLLLEHYNDRCLPPWSEKELRHKVAEADSKPFDKPRGWLLGPGGANGSKGAGQAVKPGQGAAPIAVAPSGPCRVRPQPLPPFRPFPVEALPEVLTIFVRGAAQALGCDPSYIALPAMTTAAALIGNSRALRLNNTWHEPAVLWAAVVGDSGTLKTPAQRLAVEPIYKIQRELWQAHREQQKEHKVKKASYEEKVRLARKEGRPPDDIAPEEPRPRRVVSSDITIEKVGQLLAENPRGLLVCRDELRGWLGSFARFRRAANNTDLPIWLEFFGAATVTIDRKTGEPPTLFIPRAAISVCGTIQPGVLARALTPEFFESGLTARLLLAYPPKRAKKWLKAEIEEKSQQNYETVLRQLFALEPDTDDFGDPTPFAVKLSPAAEAAWARFFERFALEQQAAEGDVAAALSKLEGYTARFALLYHVVSAVAKEEDGTAPVGPESIEAAVEIVRWFDDEMRRIYAMFTETAAQTATRKLIEFIQARGGKVTQRELMRSNCRKYPDAETAEGALAGLVEAGLARWVAPQTSMKGGKPIRAIELCMTENHVDTLDSDDIADTDDTTDAGGESGNVGDVSNVIVVSAVTDVPTVSERGDRPPEPAPGPRDTADSADNDDSDVSDVSKRMGDPPPPLPAGAQEEAPSPDRGDTPDSRSGEDVPPGIGSDDIEVF